MLRFGEIRDLLALKSEPTRGFSFVISTEAQQIRDIVRRRGPGDPVAHPNRFHDFATARRRREDREGAYDRQKKKKPLHQFVAATALLVRHIGDGKARRKKSPFVTTYPKAPRVRTPLPPQAFGRIHLKFVGSRHRGPKDPSAASRPSPQFGRVLATIEFRRDYVHFESLSPQIGGGVSFARRHRPEKLALDVEG